METTLETRGADQDAAETFRVIRMRLQFRTKQLLGSSSYLPHLLVNYIDEFPWCFYCGIYLNYDTATIEHLTPRSQSKGTLNKPKTLVCFLCNGQRADRDLAEFLTSPRLIVDYKKAGYHHYKNWPQNGFDYVGLPLPKELNQPILKQHEFGLMT